ncbi:MAG TPA: lysozyme inhibitor LprI family protein [Edaphobacter sp.]|nr:lysozyme inhibitor LprI family protein [Edaphobacter sp.]
MLKYLGIVLLLVPSCIGHAQEACTFGGDKAFEAQVKAISEASSCGTAVKRLDDCAWGSSADTQFAPIAIKKCEKEFLTKLPTPAKDRYMEEMQLCAYRGSYEQGTMSMSAAALCQANVAADFASNPDASKRVPLRTSFDCTKAQSPLERNICSDEGLGHADIILSRVYSEQLQTASAQYRQALIEDERQWLQSLPQTCHLSIGPPVPGVVSCTRSEFEKRFTALDGCFDNEPENCLKSLHDNSDGGSFGNGPRASFNCEKPSTGLEIVICADARLGQTDIELAKAYKDADSAIGTGQHTQLVANEQKWLKSVSQSCPLGPIGGIPSLFARACVRDFFEKRITQLQSCKQKPPQEQIPCLNQPVLIK